MGDPSVLIRLERLTISFAGPDSSRTMLVRDLDLDLIPGRLVGIAGRSGSGKTSVVRAAAGLALPTSGRVWWKEVDLAGLSHDRITWLRRGFCGVVDQNPVLLPELTTLENVLLTAVPDRRVRELEPAAEQLLDRVGLAARIGHRAAVLSGGERQRAALARALLLEPQVIIVDEPTASLDRAWADRVISVLVDVAHGGVAVLAASHDRALIEASDETVALE